ncbi:MAG: ATP-binding cassette domain-containing protein [Alphaproteobacteria bacterium]|nr:ATP-binding cassette domain-containing protein [Pseudomonadota bacterium]TDI63956.1 MAG: ATP-binding cassette domain-containing protein [Alphaproteobacteria bacterium]
MLMLEQVAKRFGAVRALHPLDLAVEPGRTLVVIGPSGCGKSTLLGMMNGLVRPDSGRVIFDGEVLSPVTLMAARRRMGYVIQEGGLFPHLSAAANVTLLARTLGWPPDRVNARLEVLSALTHFPRPALARFPGELSGGQRQRLSLMRALMLDPELLLLDEPLGALDPLIRFELQVELREIFRSLGKTVVMVTHDLGEAAFFADTILLMRDGRVVQHGSINDLTQRPEDPFVTRFIEAQRGHWQTGDGAS